MLWPFWTQKASDEESAVRSVDAAAIIRRARRLRFSARPSALSMLSGAYHGARPGSGLTFAELRAYEPGDDVRHLDWNVTARQGRPYVRRYIEERSLLLWLVADISASMRFGPDGRSKADRAAQAAALLATAAIRNGDRVGLMLVSDRVEAELVPGGGTRRLARILRALAATPAVSKRTDLTVAFGRLKPTAQRGLLVVLSDFLGDLPVGVWRREASRRQMLALRFLEPREQKLPNVGLLGVEDAETGVRRLIDTDSKRVRDGFSTAAAQSCDDFRSWCAATRIAGYDIDASVDPIIPLIRIFSGRAARRTSR